MKTSIKQIFQVKILNVRVGIWISLLCSVTGIVLGMGRATLGGGMIILGLAVLSITGKRQQTEEKMTEKESDS